VSSNPAHGDVYSIQHYVVKFVSDLWRVGGFLLVLQLPPPYNCNIVERDIKYHNANPLLHGPIPLTIVIQNSKYLSILSPLPPTFT
jgi:hypothetical protein